jgi:hypothetical protein
VKDYEEVEEREESDSEISHKFFSEYQRQQTLDEYISDFSIQSSDSKPDSALDWKSATVSIEDAETSSVRYALEAQESLSCSESDPTLTRFLNNMQIESGETDLSFTFPTIARKIKINLQGIPASWTSKQKFESVQRIIRKALHQYDLTYRKRERGGSYYVYSQLFELPHVNQILSNALSNTIRLYHSNYLVTKSVLSSSTYLVTDGGRDSTLSDTVLAPLYGLEEPARRAILQTFCDTMNCKSRIIPSDSDKGKPSRPEVYDRSTHEESFLEKWPEVFGELKRLQPTELWMASPSIVFQEASEVTFLEKPLDIPSDSTVELDCAFLDRLRSSLESWENSMGDSFVSKREAFVLRATQIEFSWLVSLLLAAEFRDGYPFPGKHILSDYERNHLSSEALIEAMKRKTASYLRWRWREWKSEACEIRGSLEFSIPKKLNSLSAFNSLMLRDEDDCYLYSTQHKETLSVEIGNGGLAHRIMKEACSSHRVLRKEVFSPLESGAMTLEDALDRWWILSNQKPENYIGYCITKGILKGSSRLAAFYIPNQGAWIAEFDENGKWTPVGNMGIGKGRGGKTSQEGATYHWSGFHRNTVYGRPRGWVVSRGSDNTFNVSYLSMDCILTRLIFLSDNLDEACRLAKGSTHRRFLDEVFVQDRKQDSPTYGCWNMLSPDALMSSVIRCFIQDPESQASQIWESRNRDMDEYGYGGRLWGSGRVEPDFVSMLGFIEETLYRSAYHITDASPILGSFGEPGLPKQLKKETLLDVRRNDLFEYDLLRVAKALLPSLVLEGDYVSINRTARDLSRLCAANIQNREREVRASLPTSEWIHPLDILQLKTGIIRAANLLFPLRGEVASLIAKYQNDVKYLRTGGRTNQRKLWVIRALQSIETNRYPQLREVLTELNLSSIPSTLKTRISVSLPPHMFSNDWKSLTYNEQVCANESLLSVQFTPVHGAEYQVVLVLQRSIVGSKSSEATEFISPEIDYDIPELVTWMSNRGSSAAKDIWCQIKNHKRNAVCSANLEAKDIGKIKSNLGKLYETLLTEFSSMKDADLESFRREDALSFYEVLRCITTTAYASDPRARIVKKKSMLGRPNINYLGFNIEVESTFLGQSSEHFFPFLISVLSSASTRGRAICAAWLEESSDAHRVLIGTSYGESSRWPYDLVYHYPDAQSNEGALYLESTSAGVVETNNGGTPMIISDILNRKYQALDEGAIKMMHYLLTNSPIPASSRLKPFGYIEGRIERIIYDHRLPEVSRPASYDDMWEKALVRTKRVLDRKSGLAKSAARSSWIDEWDSGSIEKIAGLSEAEQRMMFESKVSPRGGGQRSLPGLSKIWVPMLASKRSNAAKRISSSLESSDTSLALYFRQDY